jgi:hypothetical protein
MIRYPHRRAHLSVVLFLICAFTIQAQQPAMQRFRTSNSRMAAFQPAMITPLVAPDPRLVQYAKLSFANQYTPSGTQTVSFGNTRGGGVIVGNRFEFDLIPPPYIQHNSKAMDGFGDLSLLAKYRIASGNAENGNFQATAMLAHCFATGSYKNGALTDSFTPALVVGKTFHRLDAISSLGGTLPTGKIAQQGRTIAWNELLQVHATRQVWIEVENNAIFYAGGIHDGMMQNFVTPAGFYVVRHNNWKATHPYFIFDSGMQIATSGFHTYNHNLISEMRILF